MTFTGAIASCFWRYVDFSGRSARSEYWYWALFQFVAQLCLGIIWTPLQIAFSVGVFLPSLAVTVRRLHDIDRRGWWMLVWVALWVVPSIARSTVNAIGGRTGDWMPEAGWRELRPLSSATVLFLIIGLIVWLVQTCRKGTEGPNRFGADPLAAAET